MFYIPFWIISHNISASHRAQLVVSLSQLSIVEKVSVKIHLSSWRNRLQLFLANLFLYLCKWL